MKLSLAQLQQDLLSNEPDQRELTIIVPSYYSERLMPCS